MMADIDRASSSGLRNLLTSRLTLSIFVITGLLVTLGELRILPLEITLVGYPAITLAFLIDTFLFNEFLIRISDVGIWIVAYVLLFMQSMVIAKIIRLLGRGRTKSDKQTTL